MSAKADVCIFQNRLLEVRGEMHSITQFPALIRIYVNQESDFLLSIVWMSTVEWACLQLSLLDRGQKIDNHGLETHGATESCLGLLTIRAITNCHLLPRCPRDLRFQLLALGDPIV